VNLTIPIPINIGRELGSEIDQGRGGRLDGETPCLLGHLRAELSTFEQYPVFGKNLKFGWSRDHQFGITCKGDLDNALD
jgi:hypothetical protein